jgi:hypothetical protein
MARYAVVAFKNADGGQTTVRLKLVSETATRIAGYKVHADGDEVGGTKLQLFVIAVADITRRVPLVFDRQFALLVPKGTETV